MQREREREKSGTCQILKEKINWRLFENGRWEGARVAGSKEAL